MIILDDNLDSGALISDVDGTNHENEPATPQTNGNSNRQLEQQDANAMQINHSVTSVQVSTQEGACERAHSNMLTLDQFASTISDTNNVQSTDHNNHQILASSWPPSHSNGYSSQNYNNLLSGPEFEHRQNGLSANNGHYIEHESYHSHNHNHHHHHHNQQQQQQHQHQQELGVDEPMLMNGDSITLASYNNQQAYEPVISLSQHNDTSSGQYHNHHHHHHAHNHAHNHHDLMVNHVHSHLDHQPLIQDEVYWSASIYDHTSHHQYEHEQHQQHQHQHNHSQQHLHQDHNHATNNLHSCAQHSNYSSYNSTITTSQHEHAYESSQQHLYESSSEHHHHHLHHHYATQATNDDNLCLPETVIALNEHDSALNNQMLNPNGAFHASANQINCCPNGQQTPLNTTIANWQHFHQENNNQNLLTLQPLDQAAKQQLSPLIPTQDKSVIRRQSDQRKQEEDCNKEQHFCTIADLDEQLKLTASSDTSSSRKKAPLALSDHSSNKKLSTSVQGELNEVSSCSGSSLDEERSISTTTTCASQAQTNALRHCEWLTHDTSKTNAHTNGHEVSLNNNNANSHTKCGLAFNDLETFVAHLEEEHVKQDPVKRGHFFCRWFGCKRTESFNARYKLLVHMRVHSGEKPFECKKSADCKKRFSRLENLKIHVRSHTGEKPYSCNYPNCAKSFTNSSDRIKHHKTHDNPKPYPCSEKGCEKRYTDPSSLRKHQKSHRRELLTSAANNSSLLLSNNRTHNRARLQDPIGYDYASELNQQQQQQHHQATILCPADYDPNCLLLQDQASPYERTGLEQQQQHQQLASSYTGHPNHMQTSYDQQQQQQQQQHHHQQQQEPTYVTYNSAHLNNNQMSPNLNQLNQIDSQLSQTWAGPATSHQVASLNNHHPTNYNQTTTIATSYDSQQLHQHQHQHQQQQIAITSNANHMHQEQCNQTNYQSFNSASYETATTRLRGNSSSSSNAFLQMQHQQLMRSLPPSSEPRKYATQHQQQRH